VHRAHSTPELRSAGRLIQVTTIASKEDAASAPKLRFLPRVSIRLDRRAGGADASASHGGDAARRSVSLVVKRRPRPGKVVTTTVSIDYRVVLFVALVALLASAAGLPVSNGGADSEPAMAAAAETVPIGGSATAKDRIPPLVRYSELRLEPATHVGQRTFRRPHRPQCDVCASSLDKSLVEVRYLHSGGASLHIQSVADDGRLKTVGGDVWVVRFATNTSTWRQLARDLGDGSYVADVSRDELDVRDVQAWVQLWFTSLVPDYLESRWWIMVGHTPASNRSFPSLPAQNLPSADQLQCRAASRPPITIAARAQPAHEHPPITRACHGGEDGRWVRVSENGTTPSGMQAVGHHSQFRSPHEWVPFGCASTRRQHLHIGRCLAKGHRRLIIVGDSISNGFALDICARVAGRSANCSEWSGPAKPLPSGGVIISNAMGNPPRIGCGNVVGKAAGDWERALALANDSIVVLQSGAHDVSLPPPGHEKKVSPLSAYRHHIRLLAHIIARVQAVNPSVQFVWRQTTHQLLLEDATLKAGASLCGLAAGRARAFPGTNPLVIRALNEAARSTLAPLGVKIWEEPALLTLSAPLGAFRDPQHHDACGAGSDRHDGSRGSRCAAARRKGEGGAHANPADATWARMGGLSEAITDTFFDSVLGCGRT